MKFSKTDLSHSRNMLKALGKGEWKLDGIEILAFADMMKWFSGLQKMIEAEIAQTETSVKMTHTPLEPKPVEEPIKSIDAVDTQKTTKKPKQ